MTWLQKQGREGLIPKKISETVHPKQGLPFERRTTVYVKPEVPEFVNDWLNNFDSKVPIYLVGGSVRDSILGKTPKDVDVITSRPKKDVEAALKTVKTKFYQGGKNLPNLVTANLGKNQLIDILSMDTDIETELVRRDFTINAMAQKPNGEVIDPFGGRKDLKEGILRSPKDNSDKVFKDDPLRMFRAARFIGQLNLKPHSSVTDAIKKHRSLLEDLPKERIGKELGLILFSKDPTKGLNFLKENDILKYIDPALQRTVGFVQNMDGHDYDVWNHTMKALQHHIKQDEKYPDLTTRLAILYHNVGKPATADKNNSSFNNYEGVGAQLTEEGLNMLRFPADIVDTVRKLVQHHTSPKTAKTEGDHRRIQLKLRDDVAKLNYLATAHEVGKQGNADADTSHIVNFQDRIDNLEPVEAEGQGSSNLSPLSGKEIMDELDIKPNRKGGGQQIGQIKDYLNTLVIEGELKQSDKETALKRAKAYNSTFTKKSNNVLKNWLNILKADDNGVDIHPETGEVSWKVDKKAHVKSIENKKSELFDGQRSKQGLVPVKIRGTDGVQRTYWCRPGFEDKMVKNPESPYVGMFNLKDTHGHDSLNPEFKKKNVRLAHVDDNHDTHKHFTGEGKKGGLVPAGIHDLHISHDPYAEFGHKGKNKAIGRLSRSQYPGYTHPEIKALKDSQKTYQLKAIQKQIPLLNTELDKQYNSETPDVRALITGMMIETGLRIGNPKDTFDSIKKGKESYAASTLKKKHISVKGDTIKYNFPGKQETIQSGTIKNARLAKGLEAVLKNKDGDAYVFEQDGKFYNEGEVQKYHNGIMKISEGHVIKNHNFRHRKATTMTLKNINKVIDKTKNLNFIKTKGDFQDFQKRMALDAAKQLNHPDSKGEFWKTDMTINSYIMPNVFAHNVDGKNILLKDQIDNENTKLSNDYQTKMQELTGTKKYEKVPLKTVQLDKAYDGREFDPTRKKEKDIDTYFENRKEKEEDRNYGLDKIPPHMRPRPKYFTKTWIEGLADKGYISPMIKSLNPDGSKMWFVQGNTDFVAHLDATGVSHVEKATFAPLPSNATNTISYAPSASNKKREEEEDSDD
jgi:tRNA nucleotidyltransferase/poly(A) polymerase/DNA topoisomerase IB